MSESTSLALCEIVRGFGDRVRLLVDDFGESVLAKRQGIKGYPLVFVGEEFVVGPRDLGPGGKYNRRDHDDYRERFRRDLTEHLDRALESLSQSNRDGVARENHSERKEGDVARATARVREDLDGLKRALEDRVSGAEAAKVSSFLERVKSLLDEGWVLAALSECRKERISFSGFLFRRRRGEAVTSESFPELAKEIESLLRERDNVEVKTPFESSRSLAALRALGEVSLGAAWPYYRAAVGAAESMGSRAGVYYFGMALGSLEFADFIGGFEWRHEKPIRPPLRLREALDELEREMMELYRPQDLSEDGDRAVRKTTTRIKESLDLYGRGFEQGAWLKYLEGVEAIGHLRVTRREDIEGSRLSLFLKEAEERLARMSGDGSLGRIFWEKASFVLNRDGEEESDVLRARIVLEDVLPAFFRMAGVN